MPLRGLAQTTNGMIGDEFVDGLVLEAKGFWIVGIVRALVGLMQNYDCNGHWRVHQLPHPAQLRVLQQGQPCQADRLVCAGLLRHYLHRLCGNVVSLSTGCLSM